VPGCRTGLGHSAGCNTVHMADSPYRVKLSDLEATAHVPAEQQCETQPASAPQDQLGPEELDRRRLLNQPAPAGRLRPGA
jgi:hypothetical protein